MLISIERNKHRMQSPLKVQSGLILDSNNNPLSENRKSGRRPNPDTQQINENTESFRNFIRRYRNSPVTKRDYTDFFRRFIHYCNLPETRTKIGVVVGDNTDFLLFNNDSKKIQNIIKKYIDYQYDRGLSASTIKAHYNAIKHFYESNEIVLNWALVKDWVGIVSNIKRNIDMPYTYEEIHRMLDKSDERKRVIVLLLASAGMRRGALSELKYGDIKWIDEFRIYIITVYKGFQQEYETFCSMECASALNSYLDFRKRNGEEITEDSYLIRKQFDKREQSKHHKVSDASDPPEKHKLADGGIESMIYQLVCDAGIRTAETKVKRLGDRHKNMTAHSFRKFFENKCLESGIDPFYVSVLMGHKAGIGVERHYYRPDSITGENSLVELYTKKAAPYLTISEENRTKLKNRELELRMKEEQERVKRVYEDTQKIMHATTNQYAQELFKMKQDIEEMSKMKHELAELRRKQELAELEQQKKNF